MPSAAATSATRVLAKPRAMTSRQVALRISSRRTSALIRATREVYGGAGPARPRPPILTKQSVEVGRRSHHAGPRPRRLALHPRRARRRAGAVRPERDAAPRGLHLRAGARLRAGAVLQRLLGLRRPGRGTGRRRGPAGGAGRR